VSPASETAREPGPPKFIRRIVMEVRLPDGSPGTFVGYATHQPPILSTSSGPVDYRLVHERYLRDLGFEPVSVEAREIGGLDGKLESWEALYRQLEADAQRLLAANDPRVDVEV
jgi:hypothetical protein